MAHYLARAARVSLQLARDRYVFSFDPVVYQPGVAGSLAGQYVLGRLDLPGLVPGWVSFDLIAEDANLVRTIYTASLAPEDGRTSVALTRFARGYGRADDDAVIDLWIGLEALFTDREGEITYKAAMRIAHYVGDHPATRQFLFRALKRSYTVRSDLVHGDHPTNTRPARQIASGALRLALRKLLSEGGRLDVTELDDLIASASIRALPLTLDP